MFCYMNVRRDIWSSMSKQIYWWNETFTPQRNIDAPHFSSPVCSRSGTKLKFLIILIDIDTATTGRIQTQFEFSLFILFPHGLAFCREHIVIAYDTSYL